MQEERVKSTHQVLVVPFVMENHPGADQLSIVRVDGFTCVVRTADWTGVTKAAWVPPDSLVDVHRPDFAFLFERARADGKCRIKAMKLRGVLSFGLLVPQSHDAIIGDDIAEQLGVTHYEPPLKSECGGVFTGGGVESAPDVYSPKYDLDAFRKYAHRIFVSGEPVVCSEKIHGANARYVFHDGEMHCGSRSEWKREYPDYSHVTRESLAENGTPEEKIDEILARVHGRDKPQQNMWWKALRCTPSLESYCQANPGHVVYGEVYGAVQDLCYGHKSGEVSFRAFDIMVNGEFLKPLDAINSCIDFDLPWVPLFNKLVMNQATQKVECIEPIPYDFDRLCEMAEGKTTIPGASHVREGVVVSPMEERRHIAIGRVKLKIVGAGYLEKSK